MEPLKQLGSDRAPQDLKIWRESMGYSLQDACNLLDVKQAQYNDWEHGTKPTPRYILLACAALALGIKT